MTAPSTPRGFARVPRVWVDAAVLAVLGLIATVGFASVFEGNGYLLAGFGGLAVGTLVAVEAERRLLGIVPTVIIGAAAYFIFGSAFAMPGIALGGVIPTPETIAGLAVGAVHGWADIVTLNAPVEAPYYMTVVPYVATWLASLVGCSLVARMFRSRVRTPAKSLLVLTPVIALYIATVLMGTEEPFSAVARGVAFATLALVWLSGRPGRAGSSSPAARKALARRRAIGVGTIAVLAVAGGAILGSAVAPETEARYVLREEIVPPFDPKDYPSPLSGFREYTKDLKDDVLFTAVGLLPGDHIRLATMDTYDGKLWNVTSGGLYSDASGTFELVGRTLPDGALMTPGETRTVQITVGDYTDVWLPMVGYSTDLEFTEESGVGSSALRYNPWTGNAVVTTGVHEGMVYTLQTTLQAESTDEFLARVAVASVSQPPVGNVPDIVPAKAQEYSAETADAILQLRAIEAGLRNGYLSHGTAEDSIASSAGHGADRMKSLFERSQMVGDEEQYAAAFALMARSLGYPARVVMGFAPEIQEGQSEVAIRGSDVTAWVEVAFDHVGWVPFYPTPDKTDVPKDQVPQPKTEPQPQVRQPPREEPVEDDVASAVQIDQPDEDEELASGIPAWVIRLILAVGIPILLYLVTVLLVAAAKSRRRRRRRSTGPDHRRAAGAWDEVVDAYHELGYRVAPHATRVEIALDFEDQFRVEVAARAGERAAAQARARTRALAREIKVEAKSDTGMTVNPMAGFMEATLLRAKHATEWRPGVADSDSPLPVLPGLRDIAVDADAAVFGGGPVSEPKRDRLWTEAIGAVKAARASVSWFRRELSKFRVHRLGTDVAPKRRRSGAASAPKRKLVPVP